MDGPDEDLCRSADRGLDQASDRARMVWTAAWARQFRRVDGRRRMDQPRQYPDRGGVHWNDGHMRANRQYQQNLRGDVRQQFYERAAGDSAVGGIFDERYLRRFS